MKRQKIWVYGAAAVMGLSLIGCSGGSASESRAEKNMVANGARNVEEDVAADDAMDATEEYANMDMVAETEEAEGAETKEAPKAEKSEADQQKLIRTITLRTETKQFDTLQNTIQNKVEECNGYIESSEMNGSGEDAGDRSASYTIRIPEEHVDDFLKTTEKNTHILYRAEDTEDVTLDYVDTKTHIESLRVEQEALLAMLEKATKLSDIYSIQSELTDVRYQIESYESQLRTMDNKVNYTTIYLSVSEVEKETPTEEPTYLEEVKERAKDTVDGTIQALRSFSLWLISAVPGLILLALLILLGRIIWKKCSKRIKEQAAKRPRRPMQLPPNEWAYRQQMMAQPPVQPQEPIAPQASTTPQAPVQNKQGKADEETKRPEEKK